MVVMSARRNHLEEFPLPDNCQVFVTNLEVAGLHMRKPAALEFVSGKKISLGLEREPDNRVDSNAIKVIGLDKGFFSTSRFDLGYVPKEVAAAIVSKGFWGRTHARLVNTYVDKDCFNTFPDYRS